MVLTDAPAATRPAEHLDKEFIVTVPHNQFRAQDCLPTYIVVDTSHSMLQHHAVLNQALENVIEAVANSPRLAEFAHISVISFNADAHLVLPMTDVQDLAVIPQVTCGGSTAYAKAFRLVRQRIEADVPELNALGRGVLRPAVFLLTDGEPTDTDWRQAFTELTDPDWKRRPHVITFGFGGAHAAVLGSVATKRAFIANDAINETEAITTFLGELLNTLVASSHSARLELPAEIDGFDDVPLAREYVY